MSTTQRWKTRIAAALTLGLAGSALGLAVNAARGNGLPLSYQRVEQLGLLDPVQHLVDQGHAVDLDAVREAFEQGTAILIDARAESDYDQGHLPGSFSLPFDNFDETFERFRAVFGADTLLIVYCIGGDCTDSVVVREKLLERGYGKVKLYPGGWEEWHDRGMPADSGPDPLAAQ